MEMNCNPALHTNCEVLKDVVPRTVVEALGQFSDANTSYMLNTEIICRFYIASLHYFPHRFQICPLRSSTNAASGSHCCHWPVRGTLCCCTTERVLLKKPQAECRTRKTPKLPQSLARQSQNLLAKLNLWLLLTPTVDPPVEIRRNSSPPEEGS